MKVWILILHYCDASHGPSGRVVDVYSSLELAEKAKDELRKAGVIEPDFDDVLGQTTLTEHEVVE